MFEQQTLIAESEVCAEAEVRALEGLLQPLSVAPVAPANAGFQLPARVWQIMLSCYGIFFFAIFLATGGSTAARFAIVVSVLYTAMYFGVARLGARQAGREETSPLDCGGKLPTWTGPMDRKAVFAQVLVVPATVSLFGIGILIIVLAVGPGA